MKKITLTIQSLPGEKKWVVEKVTVREDGAVQFTVARAAVLSTANSSADRLSPEARALELASTWIASRFRQWGAAP